MKNFYAIISLMKKRFISTCFVMSITEEKINMRKVTFVLAIVLSLILCIGCTTGNPDNEPLESNNETDVFLRLDAEDFGDQTENVRLLTQGQYQLGEAKAKYGLDADYVPDMEGIDTLNISGSAQFSVAQFHNLAEDIRECAQGRTVYSFDLREESHGFLTVFRSVGLPYITGQISAKALRKFRIMKNNA